MSPTRGVPFLLVALGCACSSSAPEVDFCHVLKDAPEFSGETFKTDILAVPGDHFVTATSSDCSSIVIRIAESSSTGPSLNALYEQIGDAWRTNGHQRLQRGIAVHVKASIDKIIAENSPKPGYELRLLDAEIGKLVDLPQSFQFPRDSGR